MNTGKLYRLKIDIIAIETFAGRRKFMTIPKSALVRVNSDRGSRLADVYWQGRKLTLFTWDAGMQGEEIREEQAGA